jgi:shikimate kinase
MSLKKLFITGFPCTGKSTLEQMLATRRGMSSVDLDKYIEEQENMPVPQIFKQLGETKFREMESLYLQEAAPKFDIIACGGGTVLAEKNRNFMKGHGKTLLLVATSTEIIARFAESHIRPLMGLAPKDKDIKKLLFARAYAYTQADFVIDTTGLSAGEVCSRAEEILYGHD